jgi:NADPH:quinone reductase-like Zn-dependent oxidoreductase
MKAVTYQTYGAPEVLNLVETSKPAPGAGEILVRIRATTVNSGDVRMRAFDVPGLFRFPARFMLGWPTPKSPILGIDFAGEVEAVGSAVSKFKVGDRVYGTTSGSYVEYCTIAEVGTVVHIPDRMTFEEIVAIPFGALTALYFIKGGKIGPGQSMLIIGASSSVGVYSTQLATHLGATVTAVCSGRNADFVLAQGADHVIDYTTGDYMKTGPYDVVMDAVGAIDFNRARPMLKRGGVFLNVVLDTPDLLAFLSPFKDGRRIVTGTFNTTQAMLLALNDLIAEGAFRPAIDRTYPLEQIRDAHAYVDTKRKRGSVVVTV